MKAIVGRLPRKVVRLDFRGSEVKNTYLQIAFTDRKCDAAFAFYEGVFDTKRLMIMRWGEAPPEVPCPPGDENLVLRTGIQLDSLTLMGADAHPGRGKPFGGFVITLENPDEAEVKRLFAALSESGSVMMPLAPSFWSPLFGSCTDKFGIDWMISVPKSQA